jgi:hypothetical protein
MMDLVKSAESFLLEALDEFLCKALLIPDIHVETTDSSVSVVDS